MGFTLKGGKIGRGVRTPQETLDAQRQQVTTFLDELKERDASGAGFGRQWEAVRDFCEHSNGMTALQALSTGHHRVELRERIAEADFSGATRCALGLQKPSEKRSKREGSYLDCARLQNLKKLWRDNAHPLAVELVENLAECRRSLCESRSRNGAYGEDPDYHALLRRFIALAGDLPAEQRAVAKAFVKLARYSDFADFGQRAWRHMLLTVQTLVMPAHLDQQADPAKTVALACKLWNAAHPFVQLAALQGEAAVAAAKLYGAVQSAHDEHAYMIGLEVFDSPAPVPYRAPREATTGDAGMHAVPTTLADASPDFDALEAPAELNNFWRLIDGSRETLGTDGEQSPAGRTLLIEKRSASSGDAMALARALGKKAQNAGLLYFELALAGISGKYFGESAVNAKSIMLDMNAQAAERKQPAVVVIKDVDQILATRSADHSGHNQVTNALLQFINTDGAGPCRHLFIVGTTSEGHLLDPAARSRFARHVECIEPGASKRAALIQQHSVNLLGPACALELAHYASGVSMANLAMACQDATRSAQAAGLRGATVQWNADELSQIDHKYYQSLWHQITLRKNVLALPMEARDGQDTTHFEINLIDAMGFVRRGEPYRFCFRTGERVWMLEFTNFAHKKRQLRLQLCDGPFLEKDQRLFLTITKVAKGNPSATPKVVFESRSGVFSQPMDAQKPGTKIRLWDAPLLKMGLTDFKAPEQPAFEVKFALSRSAKTDPSALDTAGGTVADWLTLNQDIASLLGDTL